eukprot:TRINITY_DN22778_c0_g1_i2.p1 TRINITY_DN22778_c0_g1~~TRINITY_DN22778_c0_g1_i2.p1  ORF type:complete len:638 (-),score=84.25 TRINITY_DN22778_c0_g1_i2:84-1745(-)
MGTPSMTCQANGQLMFDKSTSCVEVQCGDPPSLYHAQPHAPSPDSPKWTPGTRATYECDAGFEGLPIEICQTDGTWAPAKGTTPCQMVGCGPLALWLDENFGSKWQHVMTMDRIHMSSYTYAGEEIPFACSRGLRGNPIALCLKDVGEEDHSTNGHWHIEDACKPFKTAGGCDCLPQWTHCKGWFGSDCAEYYGCAANMEAGRSWCKVDPESCPLQTKGFLGSVPVGDYCVSENFDHVWEPSPLPDEGGASVVHVFGLVPLLLSLCLGYHLLRYIACGYRLGAVADSPALTPTRPRSPDGPDAAAGAGVRRLAASRSGTLEARRDTCGTSGASSGSIISPEALVRFEQALAVRREQVVDTFADVRDRVRVMPQMITSRGVAVMSDVRSRFQISHVWRSFHASQSLGSFWYFWKWFSKRADRNRRSLLHQPLISADAESAEACGGVGGGEDVRDSRSEEAPARAAGAEKEPGAKYAPGTAVVGPWQAWSWMHAQRADKMPVSSPLDGARVDVAKASLAAQFDDEGRDISASAAAGVARAAALVPQSAAADWDLD